MPSVGNLKARVAAAAIAAAAILAACGSDDGGEEQASPALARASAERLAAQSDAVAALLDQGDVCGAAQQADQLKAAVAEEEIPDELRPEVEAVAEDLVNGVNCPEPPEEEEKDKEKEEKEDEKDEEEGRGEEERGPQGEGNGGGPPGQEKKEGDG